MVSKAIDDLKKGMSLYRVWIHQAYHEISAKYKRTVLGSLWISGGMVSTSLALSIIMGGIQGQNLPDALPYVMAGILSFALTSYTLLEAPDAYMAASNIIKNHAYPFTYYTFESLTRIFLIFLHNCVAYAIVMAILLRLTVPHWSIIFGLIVVYMNSFVWGALSSMVASRFRDMRFLLPFMSQIVFFVTPVFWYPHNMKGWREHLVTFNPFYGLLEVVRSPIMGHAAPEQAWILALSSLGVGVVLWLLCFNAFRGKIAFWV